MYFHTGPVETLALSYPNAVFAANRRTRKHTALRVYATRSLCFRVGVAVLNTVVVGRFVSFLT